MKAVIFFIGVLVGIGLFAALLGASSTSYHRQAKDAKEACEKSLPRDQTCKVIAVPNTQEGHHD